MKVRNRKYYSANTEYLLTLRQEYIMLGFDTSLEPGCLTVYALKRKRPHNKTDKPHRNSR